MLSGGGKTGHPSSSSLLAATDKPLRVLGFNAVTEVSCLRARKVASNEDVHNSIYRFFLPMFVF